MKQYQSNILIGLGLFLSLVVGFWYLNSHHTLTDYIIFLTTHQKIVGLLIILSIVGALIFSMFGKITSELEGHFIGALKFLNQTVVKRHGHKQKLNQLPCYLLIGPPGSGKTSLLAHAGIPYILAKRYQLSSNNQLLDIPSSYVCNWWVTQDLVIIDIPSYYTFSPLNHANKTTPTQAKQPIQVALWHNFLNLLAKYHQPKKVQAIIITINLPELIKQPLPKQNLWLQELNERLSEYWFKFGKMPLYFLVTKMDLLPGFNNFFNHIGNDELNQSWGIQLDHFTSNQKTKNILEVFGEKFNTLIKQINNQLLWRLHLESDENARHLIKDFPLQLETIKHACTHLIKTLSRNNPELEIKGIYLTSATQKPPQQNNDFIAHNTYEFSDSNQPDSDDIPEFITRHNWTPDTTYEVTNVNSWHPSTTTFVSRCFFVKKFLVHILPYSAEKTRASITKKNSKYVACGKIMLITLILSATIYSGQLLTVNFYTILNLEYNLKQYQLYLQQAHALTPLSALENAVILLNHLAAMADNLAPNTTLLSKINNYFLVKTQYIARNLYHSALQKILLPQLEQVLSKRLHTLNSNSAEATYSSLTAYLRLNIINQNLSLNCIEQELEVIYGQDFAANNSLKQAVIQHLKLALQLPVKITLDDKLIQQKRHILNNIPLVELSYIILRHQLGTDLFDDNYYTAFNLNLASDKPILSYNKQNTIIIPTLFSLGFNYYTTNNLDKQIKQSAGAAIKGNAILGEKSLGLEDFIYTEQVNLLAQQLKKYFFTHYVNFWENILTQTSFYHASDLIALKDIINNVLSKESNIKRLLNLVYNNTQDVNIAGNSKTLHEINELMKNHINNKQDPLKPLLLQLYQVNNLISANIDTNAANLEQINNTIKALSLSLTKYPQIIQIWFNELINNIQMLLLT